MTAGPVKVSI